MSSSATRSAPVCFLLSGCTLYFLWYLIDGVITRSIHVKGGENYNVATEPLFYWSFWLLHLFLLSLSVFYLYREFKKTA